MINKIQINGYKTIRELDFRLRCINILIGANGVGKSNFISFFKLIQNLYECSLETYSMQVGAENILHFGSKVTKLIYGYLQFDNTNGYEFTLMPRRNDSLFILDESVLFRNSTDYGDEWPTYNISSNSKEATISSDNSQKISKYVREHLKSFRIYHFHDTSASARIKQKGKIDDNKSLNADASNLAAYLYLLQEKHPKEFKRIELIIQSVAPFFEKFILKPDRLKEDMIQIEWKEKNSDMYLDASNISDGTLRFMALATLLLQPHTPEVIIIDEPELGLHPFAINKLAGLIKKISSNCQIIVATQSMSLIDNFEPEDIITIDRAEGQSVLNRLDGEKLKIWLDEYHSLGTLWNKNIIGGTP
jgi:predicted ATPase